MWTQTQTRAQRHTELVSGAAGAAAEPPRSVSIDGDGNSCHHCSAPHSHFHSYSSHVLGMSAHLHALGDQTLACSAC